jgi:hypothetical protein
MMAFSAKDADLITQVAFDTPPEALVVKPLVSGSGCNLCSRRNHHCFAFFIR